MREQALSPPLSYQCFVFLRIAEGILQSDTFSIFSSSLLQGFRIIVTEPIAWMIVLIQKSNISTSCDESGRGILAGKLRGYGDLSGDYYVQILLFFGSIIRFVTFFLFFVISLKVPDILFH
jgi:hypothetical protein